MLNRITLTNFQQHRDLTVNFGAGITALRGANEAGKSTLIRAICYALFGSKAMGDSLEELVTWGEPLNTLKVELELVIDGVVYTVKRGKSGAEVNYDGGIVTGQNECTNFMARQLRADAAIAPKLMLANQNEIRGALEAKGPKEAIALIEKLSEFDQFDSLLELMDEKLTLGSTANAEAAITNAESVLEAAKDGLTPPNLVELSAAISTALAAEAAADQHLANNETRTERLREEQDELLAKQRALSDASRAVDRATQRVATAEFTKTAASTVQAPPAIDLDALRARLVQLADLDKVRKARAAAEPYLGQPSIPEDERFEGTMAELQAEIRAARESLQSKKLAHRDLLAQATLAESKISTGSCTTCGQDISHLPQVAIANGRYQGIADAARLKAEPIPGQIKEYTDYVAALELALEETTSRFQVRDRLDGYIRVVDALLPPTFEWIGGEIPDNVEVDLEARTIRDRIRGHEAAQRAYDTAQGTLLAANAELDAARAALADAEKALEACAKVTDVELDTAAQALSAERAKRGKLQTAQREAQTALHQAEQAQRDAVAAHDRAVKAAKIAEETLTQRRADLKELTFNNGLLKAVRAARPVVADRLWGLVTGAVTKYFSEMRGKKSRVTKDGDGFKVDGHPSSTLSGSTLDILGLALRVALTRTFLPTAPFLVLDEPAAAMDGERTELMLGFLVSCGFPQTLIVTHEDVSESVADHVVTLGA